MAIKMKRLISWLLGLPFEPIQILKIPPALLVVEDRLWLNVKLMTFTRTLSVVSHGATTLLYNPKSKHFEGNCSTCGAFFQLPMGYFFGMDFIPTYFSVGEHYGQV